MRRWLLIAGIAGGVSTVSPFACAEFSASLYQDESSPASAAPELSESPVYGAEGAWWWTVGGGGGSSLNNGDFSAAGFVAASTFLDEDLEFVLDLTVWYLAEDAANGDDAVAVNLNPKFRWHFIHEETHTVFAEAGVGLFVGSEEVPEGGTEFNFTPQAGFGATFPLADSSAQRLIVGVNWRHFSNANTFGSDQNPGRDDIFVYAGVTFPF